jgi:hypothetical protein
MKVFLFPQWCRFVGIAALLLSILTYDRQFAFLDTSPRPLAADEVVNLGSVMSNNNLTDELCYTSYILALFLIGFSRLKKENEYTLQIRLRSLNLTVYLSYLAVAVITFTTYGMSYLLTLIECIAALPMLYIVIFYYQLYIHPRLTSRPL